MNKIIKKELKNDLKYNDTTILKYKIEYPEIISSNYEYGKNIFNYYNKKTAKELEKFAITRLYEKAKKSYIYNKENNFPVMIYELLLEYNITYNQDYIISLYSDQYQFSGGAHGSTIRNSQNWDLRKGKSIPLSFFYEFLNYYIITILKEINFQIKEQLLSGTNYYFDNYCELLLESFNLENFYLTSNKIAIFFQQYDIAPYSSGIPVFYIPYKNI